MISSSLFLSGTFDVRSHISRPSGVVCGSSNDSLAKPVTITARSFAR
jgi:hypothetical protein